MNSDKPTFPIDAVVLWVDGSDKQWIEAKSRYSGQKSLNGSERFRDWGLMKYWFRSIEENAPWINRIFFITEGHVPQWLNLEEKRLVHVKHQDYIPERYLPTFNSNVIELGIHKIPGLSEHYICFNDDTFVNRKVSPSDFFDAEGNPKDIGAIQQISPDQEFSKIPFNDMVIINQHFGKKDLIMNGIQRYISPKYGLRQLTSLISLIWGSVVGFYNPHLPVPYLKSTFVDVWKAESSRLAETMTHRFRQSDDLSIWLMRYWQLMTLKFSAQHIAFGKMFDLSSSLSRLKRFLDKRYRIICLNDNKQIYDFDAKKKLLSDYFENKYPHKSSYEL